MHPTSEMMSKCRKWHLREPKFAKFHGGACPQTPLEARASGAKKYLPKHKRTPLNRIHPTGLLYLSVQLFSKKGLIEDTFVIISYWRQDSQITWSSKPRKSLVMYKAKTVPLLVLARCWKWIRDLRFSVIRSVD